MGKEGDAASTCDPVVGDVHLLQGGIGLEDLPHRHTPFVGHAVPRDGDHLQRVVVFQPIQDKHGALERVPGVLGEQGCYREGRGGGAGGWM